MDWFGNPSHVPMPHNYWRRSRWREAFESLDLDIVAWREDLHMFPPPASWLFGRSLHFVAALDPANATPSGQK